MNLLVWSLVTWRCSIHFPRPECFRVQRLGKKLAQGSISITFVLVLWASSNSWSSLTSFARLSSFNGRAGYLVAWHSSVFRQLGIYLSERSWVHVHIRDRLLLPSSHLLIGHVLDILTWDKYRDLLAAVSCLLRNVPTWLLRNILVSSFGLSLSLVLSFLVCLLLLRRLLESLGWGLSGFKWGRLKGNWASCDFLQVVELASFLELSRLLALLFRVLLKLICKSTGRSYGILKTLQSRLTFNWRCDFFAFLSILLVVFVSKCLRIQLSQVFIELWVLSLDLLPDSIDVLELSREFRKAVKEFFDYDNSKALAFSFSSEGFNYEFKRNVLQDAVKQFVLNDGSKEFGNLLQVLLGVAVQESVFVEQAVKHASVDLLLLHNLWLPEILHRNNQCLDSCINLVRGCWEYMLEILVCSFVNFVSVLSGWDLSGE